MPKEIKKTESAGGVVMYKNEGKTFVLLARHKGKKKWVLPKGHLEKGETAEQAALREIQEETGAQDIKIIKKIGVKQRLSSRKDEWKTIHYFLLESRAGKAQIEMNIEEGNFEIKWFEISDIPQFFWPEQKEIVEEALIILRGRTS